MNRHTWREVRRQLAESRGTGLIAVVLLALAFTWGTALWLAHAWVTGELLSKGRPAAIVAVARDAGAAEDLREAVATRFPQSTAVVSLPDDTRNDLARWFPELAPVLLGLDSGSFPALLRTQAPAEQSPAIAEFIATRPETVLVENSREWQGRVEATLARFLVGGLALAVALLVGCAVVVVLVVRLLVLEHADEIAIMRLIGAREADIRAPYLACGALLGIAGGVLAALALASLWLPLRAHLASVIANPAPLAGLPLAAAAVGLVGAALGLAALPEEP